MKIKKKFGLLGALLISSLVFPTLTTNAGLVSKNIDTTTYETEISEVNWYNADGDITVQKGVFTFPDDSSANTKLMSKVMLQASKQTDKMLEAKFSVEFTKLPDGAQFSFVVGLQSLQAGLAQKGNVELVFANMDGTYKAAVVAYAEDGVASTLTDFVSVGKGRLNVAVDLSSKSTMQVVIGGKKIYSGNIPVDGNGSIGFLQTGSCGAKLSNFVFKTYGYDTPESPSFVEDFETGYYNDNLLYCTSILGTGYDPSHIKIDDFDGNKAIFFRNMGMSYIGTRYQYSNFELTFDVVYSQNKPELDEKGNTIAPEAGVFGLAYGSDGILHGSHEGYTTAANTFLVAHSGAIYCVKDVDNKATENFESQTGTFSVRLTVMDGAVSLGMKSLKGTSYTEVFRYTEETTPTGNIIFWIPSGPMGNWAIDNFKVVNKDIDGNDIDVEYKSSQIAVPEDFDYEPLGYEYNPDRVTVETMEEDKTFDSQTVIIVAAVCVVILAVTGVGILVKSKRKKGGAVHEE